jgi:hypothetical protein
MQFQQVPTQVRRAVPSMSEGMKPIAETPTTKEIPYDYVAKFVLQGKRGERVQDVINISVDGAFVAVAIGYSFIPAALSIKNPSVEQVPSSGPVIEALASGASHPLLSFIEPFVRPIAEPFPPADAIALERQTQQLELLQMVSECALLKLCGIQFKYSIVDSGSGRELQNQPIHNIAGLGESSGERPFRPFAKPMLFMPRSTIRIEIQEISVGPIYRGAELYIVLHGYKILGYGTGPS